MSNILLPQLDDEKLWFPSPRRALKEPNGLLAIGGDLRPERLMLAYRSGIFPWYGPHQPLLWWSPDPRAVLLPDAVHVSRSLHKQLNRGNVEIWINRAFTQVVEGCAAPRRDSEETWISDELKTAYATLHQRGLAHSVEVWQDEQLVGGLYGISVGHLFCGESMFHQQRDASKMALAAFCRHFAAHGGILIDCQIQNSHLATLGVVEWPRARFIEWLALWCDRPLSDDCWATQRIL